MVEADIEGVQVNIIIILNMINRIITDKHITINTVMIKEGKEESIMNRTPIEEEEEIGLTDKEDTTKEVGSMCKKRIKLRQYSNSS